ncbi:calcium-translocating P-type ATPase, PMCA-type [Lactobacillus crispatus]|uniref:calcium-translocating P-type ATPase, PMCA-type n=1 Tax=Lactobacillus crispatus TaxID=47770 RepID=UPI000F84F607|nr:calcium-translocating P-type ATPase, PMCA-type [Lactobacillus crispatus]AZR16237.1 calcium-translocating P-type ATPase, PMCA-type [Lactobacillus crispatus]MCZ9645099.1 calcium-translocating P-type ATPase, PMCA-type [Lactobacillus crispatus]MCZ9650496.1 calcium-translocating P-type ATPase, PMCA-type [Lactobacillus crispatus]MCZ9652688.1 calcium-translocating P-type ATPase, PMCA-type [Lactobacillus crispatus]MCZ9657818.1 calcium-translocating P-type ATPase, PMCA-type [Lactobacillus crispatus]
MAKKYYVESIPDIEKDLNTSVKDGLSASDAKARLEQYGPKALASKKKQSMFMRFIDQFKDFMIIVLIIAAILSGVLAHEWTDAAIIMIVVILNAILGVFQEARSEAAIDALKEMATPDAHVRRDDTIVTIPSTELVPGDVVLLEAGDVVPADLRLNQAHSLKIEESALTGESVPVEKHAETLEGEDIALADRVNMAYSNTNVTYGRGEGIVTSTGMHTEVGKIATMLNNADETDTPLKRNLNQLGKTLTIMILAICVIVFIVGVLKADSAERNSTLMINMFLVAVSLAVAAIPEGLPAIVTIILALGTQTMAKHKAIVRKLPAVETLGATDIICSDKTGTLTQNRMTVEKVFYDKKLHDNSESISENNPALLAMTLANDTKIENGGDLLGDPTETALIQFAFDQNIDVTDLLEKYKRIQEVPFDSERKLMSTVNKDGEQYFVAVKGAPDMLLQRVTRIENGGQVEPITDKQKQNILAQNKQMAQQALRVLGLAYKKVDQLYTDPTTDNVEQDLIFAGLVGMIDPERGEAKAAVAEAKSAGIRTVMITGDHQTTAQAIAERLGIIEKGQDSRVLTGAELDKLDDEYFKQHVGDYSVYARVSPEHKVRIVKAWQANDKIVAMTGDGVNDAPSLKQADIGIGMGITGTEVSKGASDMVLADDNFATIVEAVKQGRKVFSNIQKAILYLMSCNVGEVLTVFMMTMLGRDILAPVQLLWINLVTDTLPAIALGVEPVEAGIMKRKPRGKKSNFFSGGVASSIIYQGILEGILVLGAYQIGLHVGPHVGDPSLQHGDALTMAFLTLGLIQLFHAINSKYVHQSIFRPHTFSNKWFNGAIIIAAVIMAAVELPFMTKFFDVTELDGPQWLVILIAGILMVLIVEIVKFCQRKMGKE